MNNHIRCSLIMKRFQAKEQGINHSEESVYRMRLDVTRKVVSKNPLDTFLCNLQVIGRRCIFFVKRSALCLSPSQSAFTVEVSDLTLGPQHVDQENRKLTLHIRSRYIPPRGAVSEVPHAPIVNIKNFFTNGCKVLKVAELKACEAEYTTCHRCWIPFHCCKGCVQRRD